MSARVAPPRRWRASVGRCRLGWWLCERGDPRANGVVERLQGYFESNFEPGRSFAGRRQRGYLRDGELQRLLAPAHERLSAMVAGGLERGPGRRKPAHPQPRGRDVAGRRPPRLGGNAMAFMVNGSGHRTADALQRQRPKRAGPALRVPVNEAVYRRWTARPPLRRKNIGGRRVDRAMWAEAAPTVIRAHERAYSHPGRGRRVWS
jgi:hypothetical protein